MNLKKIKLEIFYLKKSFFQYKKGFQYLNNKFFLAPKILAGKKVLSKPINNTELSIHILTCHRDLVMLIWSLASFYYFSKVIGQLYIHSDGSLTPDDKKLISQFFLDAIFIEPSDILEKNSQGLNAHPVIKQFRIEHQNDLFTKKIIDSFFVSDKKFHLLFDSDILWFKDSQAIFDQLNLSLPKSLMIGGNGGGNYVYFKDGTKLSDDLANFNAGVIFYSKDNFDLNRLAEFLTKFDTAQKRNFYFLEQAGHAYCLNNLNAWSKDKYFIHQTVDQNTIAKHYTSPRRPLFYIEGIEILKDKILS
ncbi:MAG: hypothetical protein WCW26_00535 [Candidatus Buchananbacteria bacterium]